MIKPGAIYELAPDGRVLLEMQDIADMVADVKRLEWVVKNSVECMYEDDDVGIRWGINACWKRKEHWRDAIDEMMKTYEEWKAAAERATW